MYTCLSPSCRKSSRARLLAGPQPLLEGGIQARRIEDDEGQLLPVVAPVLPPHDAHRALEGPASAKEFSVERKVRQPLGEPVRREEGVALAAPEGLAVPVRAHPIQLLTHPPAGEVHVRLPRMGQQQRRRAARVLGGGAGALGATRLPLGPRLGLPHPSGLGLLTSHLAQVLAGAPLDGHRLVAPRGATARVHAPYILEDVGLRPRALHLDLPSIRYVGHDSSWRGTLPDGG
jgi:hypothetical protein